MQKWLKVLVVALGVIIFILLGILVFVNPAKAPPTPIAAGHPVGHGPMISFDRRLAVVFPFRDDLVTSPLVASGTVTGGGWFFEASFPVKILDGDGTVLGQGIARAQGDWMTTASVPFLTNIAFSTPKSDTGTVVFMKDNPSGAPENAGELVVPVRFR